MPKVYVIQENRKIDISPAEEYGDIKIVLPSGDANYSQSETYDKLYSNLSNFDVENDYILLTGDPAAIFMAGGILCDLVFENMTTPCDINVLKWNRRTNRYLSLKTPISRGTQT